MKVEAGNTSGWVGTVAVPRGAQARTCGCSAAPALASPRVPVPLKAVELGAGGASGAVAGSTPWEMSKDVHLGTPGPPQLKSRRTDQFPGAVVVSVTRIFAQTLPQGLPSPGHLQHPSGCVARASFSPVLLRGGLLPAAGGSAASGPRTPSL